LRPVDRRFYIEANTGNRMLFLIAMLDDVVKAGRMHPVRVGAPGRKSVQILAVGI
jgi:hypothetical protein